MVNSLSDTQKNRHPPPTTSTTPIIIIIVEYDSKVQRMINQKELGSAQWNPHVLQISFFSHSPGDPVEFFCCSRVKEKSSP